MYVCGVATIPPSDRDDHKATKYTQHGHDVKIRMTEIMIPHRALIGQLYTVHGTLHAHMCLVESVLQEQRRNGPHAPTAIDHLWELDIMRWRRCPGQAVRLRPPEGDGLTIVTQIIVACQTFLGGAAVRCRYEHRTTAEAYVGGHCGVPAVAHGAEEIKAL